MKGAHQLMLRLPWPQARDVLSYQPLSAPLCPAYFLAVDHPGRTIALVRGAVHMTHMT